MVRIKPGLYQKVALKAKIEDKSMNNWIEELLEKAVR